MNKSFVFSKRSLISLGIVILVALLHIVRIGSYLQGNLHDLYYAYFSDLVIPIAAYFLLCFTENQLLFLKRWWVKALVVFLLAALAETLQYFGLAALGSTFDPLDYLMYFLGAVLAVLLDLLLFHRLERSA